jgi:phage gpG-like protein
VDVTYSADTSGLSAAFAKVIAAAEAPAAGPMRDGFTQAAALYLAFTRRRFVTQSQGGGEWPDLALSTKVARARKTKAGRSKYAKARRGGQTRAQAVAGRKFAILRDTSTLFNSLSTGAPGSTTEYLPAGIRVGTAIKYAKYHQSGGPHLPQRRIFVDPDPATQQRIQSILAGAIVAAMQQAK